MNTTGPVEVYLPNVIDDMVAVYEDNLIDKEYISKEVMEELSDLFLQVPIELRASVFRGFQEELLNRNIPFVLEAFKGNA